MILLYFNSHYKKICSDNYHFYRQPKTLGEPFFHLVLETWNYKFFKLKLKYPLLHEKRSLHRYFFKIWWCSSYWGPIGGSCAVRHDVTSYIYVIWGATFYLIFEKVERKKFAFRDRTWLCVVVARKLLCPVIAFLKILFLVAPPLFI